MKKLLRLLLLLSIISFSTTNAQVFICGGEYSERYHASPDCRGLNNCRSEIYEIDEYEAINIGRTPCQIEYVYKDQLTYSNSTQNYKTQEPRSKWEFLEKGNPIDGFSREAISKNNGSTINDYFLVKVINENKDLNIPQSPLGGGLSAYEHIRVEIRSNNDFIGIERVLFYFDSENNYYEANFIIDDDQKGVIIRSATPSDANKHVTKSQIINMLKNKNHFNVRLYYNYDKERNVKFNLNGSTSAINKTVDVSKGLGKDIIFDQIWGGMVLSKIYKSNDNFDAFIEKYNLDRKETIDELVDELRLRLGNLWYNRLLISTFENETIIIKDMLFREIFKDRIFNIIDIQNEGKMSVAESTNSIIEDVPIFPGCEIVARSDRRACFQEKMNNHIRENFRYPEIAQQMGIQGRVYTQFIIEKDGSITNIRVRGPDINLEREAKRIISLLPKMTPGFQNGKPVRVPYSTPITFRFQ